MPLEDPELEELPELLELLVELPEPLLEPLLVLVPELLLPELLELVELPELLELLELLELPELLELVEDPVPMSLPLEVASPPPPQADNIPTTSNPNAPRKAPAGSAFTDILQFKSPDGSARRAKRSG